jgi:intracellular multiplication protein IcmL
MASDQQEIQDDALVLIYTRNFFYKRKYQTILALAALCLIVIFVLIGLLINLIKDPPHPLYFVTDNAGRLIRDIPVQQPNMSDQDVAAIVKEAVVAAYSYDFMNYRGQLQAAQKYFTDWGWKSYMKGLDQSDNLLGLTQHKWVVKAEIVGEPKLVGAGPLGAAKIYAWKFEMPVLVSYYQPPNYDEKTKTQNPLMVSVIIQREDILSSYQGLGIAQIIATFAQSDDMRELAKTL